MKNLVVIFGGNSVEHDVSIITALQAIDRIKDEYKIFAVYFGLDNNFYLTDKRIPTDFINKEELIKNSKQVVIANKKLYLNKKGKLKLIANIDSVLNCCHGGIGENGGLYSYLKINGLNSSSADNISSAICMNKYACKCFLANFDIPVVKGVLIDKFSKATELVKIRSLSNNLIVKANNLGSSIGVETANQENVQEKIHNILELDNQVLVEERVEDLIEYNCAILKDKDNFILSEIEKVTSTTDILSYNDKYVSTKSRREIPAKIDKALEELILNYTKKAYQLLNLSGVVRIDYLYNSKQDKLYLNEINTVPGSLAFYLFQGRGIDYIELVDILTRQKIEENNYNLQTDILTKTSFQIK